LPGVKNTAWDDAEHCWVERLDLNGMAEYRNNQNLGSEPNLFALQQQPVVVFACKPQVLALNLSESAEASSMMATE